MIKINKKIEYALMALKYMAQHKEREERKPICAREIVQRFKIPFDTTAKVLQLMNHKGILSSIKGIKGGYHLALPLSQITFGELLKIINREEDVQQICQSHRGRCELYERCNIATPLDILNKKVHQYLSQLNLEELLLNEYVKNFTPLPNSSEDSSENSKINSSGPSTKREGKSTKEMEKVWDQKIF